MNNYSFAKAYSQRWRFLFCISVLFTVGLASCSSSEPTTNPPMDDEDPEMENMSGSSSFSGKLALSSSVGWPINVFDLETGDIDIAISADPQEELIGSVTIDPTAKYLAYSSVQTDGLVTGRFTQIVLRDNVTEQETRLPFDLGTPTQWLNSSEPSVSSTGIVVFEQYVEVLNSAGFPDDRINEGIAYWNGSGQSVALATSASDSADPLITEDGDTVFFVADSANGRAIWKTQLSADSPELVWAPGNGASLAVNGRTRFQISSDGNTFVVPVIRDGENELDYVTPNTEGTISYTDADTSLLDFELSGDGSTLMVTTATTMDDIDGQPVRAAWRLNVVNLDDGSQFIAEDSSDDDGIQSPQLFGLAVSRAGDLVAMVSGDAEQPSNDLFGLYVFKPGEFSAGQRLIGQAEYGGVTIATMSIEFAE